METSIEILENKDIIEAKNLLSGSKSLMSANLVREILEHISDGIALKLIVDGKIKGIWCSLDMKEYTSLSFFFIHPDIRRTMLVFSFFKTCISFIDTNKPIIIKTKDTTGFEKYVEYLGDDTYYFKGLR